MDSLGAVATRGVGILRADSAAQSAYSDMLRRVERSWIVRRRERRGHTMASNHLSGPAEIGEIVATIRTVISTVTKGRVSRDEISMGTPLAGTDHSSDADIDSIEVLDLLLALEEHFQVELVESSALWDQHITTVGGLSEYIQQLLA